MKTQTPTTETTPKRKQVQPLHHAHKTRTASALRRKQIIKAVVEGRNLREVAIATGLSPKTASQQVSAIMKEPEVQRNLQAAMEAIGIDDAFLARHHKELIEATKVVAANVFSPGSGTDLADVGSMTKDFVEVPDFIAKAKGLEMLYKLRGKFTERHEVDLKRPVNIIIRKFCTREQPPKQGAAG